MGNDNDRQHFEDYRAQTQVKHEILAAYLKPYFQIVGVRRIAGLKEVSKVLIELLGSNERAVSLFDALQKTADVGKRERLILDSYRQAINEVMKVKFTIPFRVESEERKKTSHYLIHATKHPLGFKIMKEVMWAHGQSETGERDLQYVQASRTDYIPLFDPNYVEKDAILKELTTGPKPVKLFSDEWVLRPTDLLCSPAYKKALLELEESGEIEVLDKDKRTPKPAKSRQQRKGKPTLGDDYYIRLIQKTATT